MSANSKHLRLARRALRTYRTHLFDAVGLMSCDEATRERIAATAKLVQRDIDSRPVDWRSKVAA